MAKSDRLNIEASHKLVRMTKACMDKVKQDRDEGIITSIQADYTAQRVYKLFKVMAPDYVDVLIGQLAIKDIATYDRISDSIKLNTGYE